MERLSCLGCVNCVDIPKDVRFKIFVCSTGNYEEDLLWEERFNVCDRYKRRD